MPQPPSVNPLTTYLFDNFWPAALLLLIAAGALAIAWQRTGGRRSLGTGAVGCIALAIAIIVTERIVTTSGERAASITIALVDAAVAGDIPAARAQFSADATMSFASPQNPGESIDFIHQSLEQLRGRYSIADNHIASLRAYSISRSRAEAHLRVITRLEQFPYSISSSWVLEIGRRPDGTWKIEHITFVEFSGQTPGRNVFR